MSVPPDSTGLQGYVTRMDSEPKALELLEDAKAQLLALEKAGTATLAEIQAAFSAFEADINNPAFKAYFPNLGAELTDAASKLLSDYTFSVPSADGGAPVKLTGPDGQPVNYWEALSNPGMNCQYEIDDFDFSSVGSPDQGIMGNSGPNQDGDWDDKPRYNYHNTWTEPNGVQAELHYKAGGFFSSDYSLNFWADGTLAQWMTPGSTQATVCVNSTDAAADDAGIDNAINGAFSA